ncbi:glycerol-3-phosphate dehydrogenase [Legionella sp. km772]|uniref:glycerol-3-phosphate dehydrogenase n=1 Tax=Legionella sp. km772 TaxID=2498111 RepID=UPI000F8DD5F9|nr:glycerol-3-phosphate dehydrogenase [Legionella sp. km772]RUR09662.1 glycerol-3-phosphate dehydrogenase [Legionella sp. km772]
MDQIFDVAIIGGGINGCGCAADAALRGLSVILFEQDDLASKTSSSSTKLIHGGLRYLEHYEFSLVKKALIERQTLLSLAPHLVHPQAFVLPYQKYMRPSWFLRIGLFLYDHLSTKNRLPHCKTIYREESAYFDPLLSEFNHGFLFYDAATDDVRLTISNALQAKNHGASIKPRAKVIKTAVSNNTWILTIQPAEGKSYQVKAKTLINAAGPWVEATAKLLNIPLQHQMTLVKGSHIIVPKLYEGKHAYFLQHQDKRVIFVIPYHGYSMIGTTDIPFNTNLDQMHISNEETDYLINLTNSYFNKKLKKTDLVYSWSGVRPLIAAREKDASSLSRDYSYEVTNKPAPMITILGGKITTYRQLAEDVIDQLKIYFPQLEPSRTQNTPLPGAKWDERSFADYFDFAQKKYHWLPRELLDRYLNSYGTNTELFLGSCTNLSSLGKCFGTELYQVELDYLTGYEWAKTLDDVLFRRTKLGLAMSPDAKKELEEYLNRAHFLQTKEKPDFVQV